MDKKHCVGCDNNFYNGNNPLGIKECTHFKDAKLIFRYRIGWWVPQTRKENFVKVTVPNCYTQIGKFGYKKKIPEHLTSVPVGGR